MQFKPDLPAPTNSLPSLASWAARQLQQLAALLNDDVSSVSLEVLYAVPDQPRAGMVIYADGTRWNPGAGEGVYRRNAANTAWVFLG